MPSDARLSPSRITRLRRSLNAWYAGHRRDLPWRSRSTDPYAVLVSEFMLQQTQVATVLPHYRTFMERFPTLESLARAEEEEVRAAWSGLGYYRRARDLQAAGRRILTEHAGRLPDDPDAIRRLPGVGEYTAAALASIVHDIPRGAVDGNVVRVLTRLTAHRGRVTTGASRRFLQETADRLVDPERPGDWNQGVMELGATVCLPRRPRCGDCPWRRDCLAHRRGEPERYPVKGPARSTIAVERAVAVVRRGSAVLLVHRNHPRLLDGTWELPGLEVPGGANPRSELERRLAEVIPGPARVGAELAGIRHAVTHRRFLVRAFAVHPERLPRARAGTRRWAVPGDLDRLPVSSMTTKLFRELERPPETS